MILAPLFFFFLVLLLSPPHSHPGGSFQALAIHRRPLLRFLLFFTDSRPYFVGFRLGKTHFQTASMGPAAMAMRVQRSLPPIRRSGAIVCPPK